MKDFNVDAHLCNAEKSCLVIIDVQTRLVAAMPAKVLARMKRSLGVLLKSADVLSIPTIVTEQYPQGLGETEPEIGQLLGEKTARFEKTCFSCASAEGFLEALKATGASQAILVGMEAHICVLQTAMQLRAEGYHIFVVSDAICSRQRESYEAALVRMSQAGFAVCQMESVLFEWLRDSRHEHFKQLATLAN